MSVAFTTSDHYTRSEAPGGGGSFTAAMWVRRDADTGADEQIFQRSAGGFTNQNGFKVFGASDFIIAAHGGEETSGLHEVALDTWYYYLLHYQGESTPGSSADGVLTIKYLADGATAFTLDRTITGRSDLSPDRMFLAAYRGDNTSSLPGTFAFCKIWTSVLSDADALTEREYRHAQTNLGGLWAEYTFDSGAIATDTSGNARTLTAFGTPTHSADEPTAVLGDDPGGSPAGATLSRRIVAVVGL